MESLELPLSPPLSKLESLLGSVLEASPDVSQVPLSTYPGSVAAPPAPPPLLSQVPWST